VVINKLWQQFVAVLLVALIPFVALLIRGVGWGSDSFAFYSVACGNTNLLSSLSTGVLVNILPLFNCNFILISFTMFLFYFVGLLSLWIISKKVLKEHAWLLPIYVGTLTPLFFIEGLRFENDLFGWTLAFLALALFSIALNYKNLLSKALVLVLSISIGIISFNLWTFSIIILCMFPLFLGINYKYKKTWVILIIMGFIFCQQQYLLHSFNINYIMLVAEEIPLIGLVYIIHILHFWKKIPQPFFLYGLFFLGLGILKSKYLFLATPFLLMALIQKEKTIGLWLESKRFSNRIEIVPIVFVIIFGLGFVLTGVSMYPTQNDFIEMQGAIDYATDNNIPLVNEWGSGWYFAYLGFETKYRMGPPDPDWNILEKPFVAYSRKIELDCNKLSQNTYLC